MQTKPSAILGATCSAGTDCASGNCVDGVCCETACDGECMSCVGASTHGADGACLPVAMNTDPDMECMSSCTPEGAVKSTCGGAGACAPTTTVCGFYACDASNVSCRTSCNADTDCAPKSHCDTAAHVCTDRLRIALVAGTTSCLRDVELPAVINALKARGHTATIVTGADIDSAAEINAYDVVVVPSNGNGCTANEQATYDAVLTDYVMGGGGLVGNGWIIYNGDLGPNMTALMPVMNSSYDSGATLMTPVGMHPIIAGVNAFTSPAAYAPYGTTLKAGATQLLKDPANNSSAAAWEQGMGRTVFVGALFLDEIPTYQNANLTNGSIPDALNFFVRSIEWAGGLY